MSLNPQQGESREDFPTEARVGGWQVAGHRQRNCHGECISLCYILHINFFPGDNLEEGKETGFGMG